MRLSEGNLFKTCAKSSSAQPKTQPSKPLWWRNGLNISRFKPSLVQVHLLKLRLKRFPIRITSIRWWPHLPPKHRDWSSETLRSFCCASDRAIGACSCNICSMWKCVPVTPKELHTHNYVLFWINQWNVIHCIYTNIFPGESICVMSWVLLRVTKSCKCQLITQKCFLGNNYFNLCNDLRYTRNCLGNWFYNNFDVNGNGLRELIGKSQRVKMQRVNIFENFAEETMFAEDLSGDRWYHFTGF